MEKKISENTCLHCGTPLIGGRNPNYISCHVCKQKVCKKCAQLGLCRDHYAELSQDQITNLKLVNKRFLIIAVLVMIALLTGAIILLLNLEDQFAILNDPVGYTIFGTVCAILILPFAMIGVKLWQKKIDAILFQHL
ncbi:MAG: hypothetical protein ACTSVZ_12345 [Promethearchaeota archaeon]